MKKGTTVIYVDPAGKEHEALVKALNGLNEGFITVTYIDVDAPEAENLKTVFDIAHMSHSSKDESNPGLPRTVLNAWREKESDGLPSAADLDAAAAEEEAKEATKGKNGKAKPIAVGK